MRTRHRLVVVRAGRNTWMVMVSVVDSWSLVLPGRLLHCPLWRGERWRNARQVGQMRRRRCLVRGRRWWLLRWQMCHMRLGRMSHHPTQFQFAFVTAVTIKLGSLTVIKTFLSCYSFTFFVPLQLLSTRSVNLVKHFSSRLRPGAGTFSIFFAEREQ